MMGFVFGTVCLLLLVRMMARRAWWRHAHGHGFGAGFGPGGHGCGRGGRGGGGGLSAEQVGRAAGEVMKRRLGVDGDQEGVVDHALIDLRATLKELAKELRETKKPLIDAFAGESVDDGQIAAAFARQDDAVARARREAVSSLKQIHAVLRPDQRERAAAWLASLGGPEGREQGGRGWL